MEIKMNNKKTTNSEIPIIIMSFLGTAVLVAIVITFFFVAGDFARGNDNNETTRADIPVDVIPKSYIPITYSDTIRIESNEINGKNAILVNLNTNSVIAEKAADARIYPASMTKVMTVLVAVEHIENLNDTFLMTADIIAPLISDNATRAGFIAGDEIPIMDLLYGAILPSGADATIALARYVADSEEEFAKLMNQKAAELGLTNTSFTNSSGLYDVNHYSTVRDIATIMACAMDNSICKQVLCANNYQLSVSSDTYAGGILPNRWSTNLAGDEPSGVIVKGAKTGYEILAGHSMVSYAVSTDGKTEYILVTAAGEKLSSSTPERKYISGSMQPIYDLKYLYSKYAK